MAKKEKSVKTNALRMLDQAGVSYDTLEYDVSDGFVSGVDSAEKTGRDVETVFKTLVTIGSDKQHYVCVIPVAEELDLKKAAKAFGVKKIDMLPMKELTNVTGYIKGGCSPIGMKKSFETAMDETAQLFDTISISGGKPGLSVALSPDALSTVIDFKYVDLIV